MYILNKSKIIVIKKLIKINNIYFKNFQIVFEKINKNDLFNWSLICHALTSSHHFQGIYIKNLKNKGWWEDILDDKLNKLKLNLFCINDINSNFGTTNNLSINPIKNQNYNFDFPIITFVNWIKLKFIYIKKNLKIKKLFIILGGSFGGMQVLLWSILYPNFSNYFICIATTNKMSKINLINNEINKLLINYNIDIFKKKYFNYNIKSVKNLKLLRIIGHLSYLSKQDINNKNYKDFYNINYKTIVKKFKLSNYFFYKSNFFYKYFNINSYLYIINFINKFNININNIINKINNYFIINFINDKRFKYKNSIKIIYFLLNNYQNLNFKTLYLKSGHDSFLIKNSIYNNIIYYYIKYISER